jgi:NAD(P)-dependent dehydrogenase (short-subunit alcohol dehydrogenase family)
MSKVILITGGSRGIGRATALLCGARGWAVGVNYAGNREAAERTVADTIKAGGRAIAIQGDVAREADVIAMFDRTEEAFGRLDGLVNNAGIVAPSLPLADMTFDRMKRVFDTNVLGAYLCAREAARRLSRGRGGKGGAANEYVDYAGSKGAVDTMTVGLAREIGPEGVRVNAVRPGLIDTEIHASGGKPDRAQRLGSTTPLGRAGTAEEVAEAIVWLLSDASSYVNGALVDVSAGR